MKISGWGNYPVIDSEIVNDLSLSDVDNIKNNKITDLIPRGLGKSYGDSSLNENKIISTLKYNRIIKFDDSSGEICCESGVSLEEILEIFVPKGWFLAVTPGTKLITVGGAVASDVHGKNHHKGGSFCDGVSSLSLLIPSGETITCSDNENQDIFRATCGGMGLTGIIIDITFKLIPIETAYIKQNVIKAKNLTEIIKLFEESVDTTFSVAWIDCLAKGKDLGRSIMMKGEFASKEDIKENYKIKSNLITPKKRKLNIPFNFPNIALNKLTIKAFNFLYYNKAKNKDNDIVDYNSFFYPLDAIDNWNRIYGNRGFTQYQFVLPKETSEEGLTEILSLISKKGYGSFLAVLKLLGKENQNLLSFHKEGYTLALDFPISKKNFSFFNQLDELVLKYGGRLYLTKDVRVEKKMFEKMYAENIEDFRKIRKKNGFDKVFNSLQSVRLEL